MPFGYKIRYPLGNSQPCPFDDTMLDMPREVPFS